MNTAPRDDPALITSWGKPRAEFSPSRNIILLHRGENLPEPVKLRDYQVEAITAVKRDWESLTDVLIVAATGAGKTVTFLALLRDVLAPGKRGLILAHRRELIDQPIERLEGVWPEILDETGVVMANENEIDRRLTIASVQTLASPARLAMLLSFGPIDFLVTDEAHHSSARTYQDIYAALRKANPALRHLGVTATPLRADGDGLAKTYQKTSHRAGIKELVRRGYLVPFSALAIQLAVSLKGVPKNDDGDFVATKLAQVVEMDNAFDLVVASHKKYAGDRLAMAFTPSVEGAHRLAQRFTEAGIPAAAADGTTGRDARREAVDSFKRGETKVLCNAMLWTEGVDLPPISCIHWLRPTTSDSLYVQGIGRGLRLYPGKENCLILDYVPQDARNIVMAGDLLGKPRTQRELEDKARQAGLILEGFSFTGDGNGIDGDPDQLVARPLNYMAKSPLRWHFDGGISTLGLGEVENVQRALAILPPTARRPYRLVVFYRERGSWRWQHEELGRSSDVEELVDQGAEYAAEHGAAVIFNRAANWSTAPLSPSQESVLARLYPGERERIHILGRGEASQLITSGFIREAISKAKLA